MAGFNCLSKCARYFFPFSRNIFRPETIHLLLRIILESFFLTSNTCDEYFALQTQIRSDASRWMPESFDAPFPVSVNSFIVIGVPTFVLRPLKIQMFGGQTFLFEPTLNLFSRYVSTVGSKRRYHNSRVCVDVAGRESCLVLQ